MTPLAMLWTDIRILLVDTTRIWWRMLPKILAIFLFGWLGYQVALKIAIPVGHINSWLALLVFSFSFVSKLAAVILILRLVGNALGVRRLIPRHELEEDDRSMNYRIALAGPTLRGRGYGTEAGRAVVAWAFDVVGLHRVSLEVYAFNPAAQRSYEKIGFVVEGRAREVLRDGDGWVDAITMGLLASDPRPR